jgi:hypothetical protein
MLTGQVSKILTFGGYFDHSLEKDARMELHRSKTTDCTNKINTYLVQLIVIAETDTIPDFFTQMDEVAEPKRLLAKRATDLAGVASYLLVSNDLRIKLADNLVTALGDLSTEIPTHADIFRAEAEKIELFRQLCSSQREDIQDFAHRMQPNPF